MLSHREAFLQRVRRAVRHGHRAGQPAPLPDRGGTGYQGAGADPLQHFCQQLTTLGGHPHLVADREAALAQAVELVQAYPGHKILLGRAADWEDELTQRLRALGKEVLRTGQTGRDGFFAADVAITGVKYLIAETGSLVVAASPDEPRFTSLLPPVLIVLAHQEQVLADLFDLFAPGTMLAESPAASLPSAITIITGPSKTGDIELRLVTGVHGPGKVHVVLQKGWIRRPKI